MGWLGHQPPGVIDRPTPLGDLDCLALAQTTRQENIFSFDWKSENNGQYTENFFVFHSEKKFDLIFRNYNDCINCVCVSLENFLGYLHTRPGWVGQWGIDGLISALII